LLILGRRRALHQPVRRMTALASLRNAQQTAPAAALASLWSELGGDPAALARVDIT
jgi:hypothetical protein